MLKVIELFAGIGSQTQALKNLNIEHEVVAISEIDKYAIKSYEALHGNVNNLGDICTIDKLPKCDLLTYSFPCQDISVAGKQEGIKEGTRSGLLLEVERLLEVSDKPKYLLLENVKNLVGKKHRVDFDKWLKKLENLGYKNFWQILNAKDYGVPQNRERVFVVSILGDDKYEFPKKIDCELYLKDILEDAVEEKYYMTHQKAEDLINIVKCDKKGSFPSLTNQPMITSALGSREHRSGGWKNVCGTLCARDYKDPKVLAIPIDSTVYKPKELEFSNCITARYDAGIQNKQSIGVAVVELGKYNFYLRKLTPKECWRLMGFKDEEFQKAVDAGISNTQLYKQAGNSIVVKVLECIFRNLFIKR